MFFLYFSVGIKILLLLAIIFYIVFFSLAFYWHETRITLFIVPLLYTFQFFLGGFLVLVIISFILDVLI